MGIYLKTVDNDWYKQRLTLVLLCVVAAFSLLFARLFYLQVIEGEEYRRISANNCIRLQSLDAPRGLIMDRNGRLLVDNRPAFDLSIVPKDAKPVAETIEKLAHYLRRPVASLTKEIGRDRLAASYKPVVLQQDISWDDLATVEVNRFHLPGVMVNIKPRRHYVEGGLAAHLLGYLGQINTRELACGDYPDCRSGDSIGKFGVEKTFEPLLRGQRGGQQVEVDVRGRVVRVLETVDPRPGYNLYLTIDRELQKKAESLLEGKAGAVAAIDPANGHVLVMASCPYFDQNDFVNGLSQKQWRDLLANPDKPMTNKVIQAEYPPASTYKIVTAIAGLEEGIIDENTTFFCPGHYKFGNRVYRCWRKGGHGHTNVVKALEESCDVFFYQVGQKLGIDRLAWYAKACGLGSPTGIALDNESDGLVPTASWKKKRTGISWQAGETLSVAIGQGYNLATPLQMAVLVAAIGNGGVRYKPTILQYAKESHGRILQNREPEVVGKLPISEKNLALVRKGLWKVVNGSRGTARKIALDGVDIAGKTGTAQVFSRKKNEDNTNTPVEDHLKPHAWFVAYAPEKKPRIAIAVIVEHGEHGSSAAAPIAGELIKAYLQPEKDPGMQTADGQPAGGESGSEADKQG